MGCRGQGAGVGGFRPFLIFQTIHSKIFSFFPHKRGNFMKQSSSNSNVLTNHLEIWLKCRFTFSRSGAGPESLHFNKLSAEADKVGLWTTL